MVDAVWPASLPQRVLVEGYNRTPAQTALRTKMDAGPAKMRRRFSAGSKPVKAKIRINAEQVQTLEGFFEDTLKGGVLPFTWIDPVQQQTTGLEGFGSCIKMSAENQSVKIFDNSLLSFTNNIFSIEFWLKARDVQAPFAVLSKGQEYAINIVEGTGQIALFAFADAPGFEIIYQNIVAMSDTEWHHWAWVGNDSVSKVYLDGVQIDSTAKVTGSVLMGDSSADLRVGLVYDPNLDTIFYGDGLIDDLRFWNVARSAGNILSFKDSELVGNETGLKAYYKFNEQTGVLVGDSTANNINGYRVGAKWFPEITTYRFTNEISVSGYNGVFYEATLEMEILP